MNATIHMGRRVVCLLSFILALAINVLKAQEISDAELDALLEDPDALDAWLEEEFTGWDFSALGRVGWGRSDNVLLATVNPQTGDYVRSEFEMFLTKLPDDSGEFFSYLSLTDLRYSGVEDADKEQMFLSSTQWKRYLSDRLSGVLKAQYVYFDQILDLSLTERQEARERIQFHGYGLGSDLEYLFTQDDELTFGFIVLREEYAEVLGNDWLGRLEFEWERPFWLSTELSAKLRAEKRDYDERSQRDIFGRSVEGDRLKVNRNSAMIELSKSWGKQKLLESALEVRFLRNRDNGVGYYDYDQWSIDLSLEGEWKGFEARAGIGLDDSEFLIQTVERFNPLPRKKKDYWGELFLRRELGGRWSIYLLAEFEESNSNVVTDEYDVLSGSLGFQIDFGEK
ncbi:MAG: hypothetical protein P8L44_01320 [Opitutales bacterium]|nr:hypothetical protein [Opitutales bacterium]